MTTWQRAIATLMIAATAWTGTAGTGRAFIVPLGLGLFGGYLIWGGKNEPAPAKYRPDRAPARIGGLGWDHTVVERGRAGVHVRNPFGPDATMRQRGMEIIAGWTVPMTLHVAHSDARLNTVVTVLCTSGGANPYITRLDVDGRTHITYPSDIENLTSSHWGEFVDGYVTPEGNTAYVTHPRNVLPFGHSEYAWTIRLDVDRTDGYATGEITGLTHGEHGTRREFAKLCDQLRDRVTKVRQAEAIARAWLTTHGRTGPATLWRTADDPPEERPTWLARLWGAIVGGEATASPNHAEGLLRALETAQERISRTRIRGTDGLRAAAKLGATRRATAHPGVNAMLEAPIGRLWADLLASAAAEERALAEWLRPHVQAHMATRHGSEAIQLSHLLAALLLNDPATEVRPDRATWTGSDRDRAPLVANDVRYGLRTDHAGRVTDILPMGNGATEPDLGLRGTLRRIEPEILRYERSGA